MSEAAEKIAKILEDPESIKMISEIAESFMSGSDSSTRDASGEDSNLSEDKTDSQQEENDERKINTLPLIPKDNVSLKFLEDIIGKGDVENSIKLIVALKPYMSKRRRDSADSVIKWLKLLKLVGKSNISEISKLINLM